MARRKQRENYRNGSVVAETVKKLDKDGNQVMDKDGKPVRVARHRTVFEGREGL